MLNLMLCGCQGKMGRVIEECTLTRGDCRIAAGIDLNTEEKRDFPVYASPADCKEAMDAIIDFSHPNSLNGLLAYAKTHKTPLVIATTGYSKEQIDQIHEAAKEIPLFFTFNMSLGVNLLADLARRATAVLGDQFDIEIIEKHHNRKLDAPSGTALMIADGIREALPYEPEYIYDRTQRHRPYAGRRHQRDSGQQGRLRLRPPLRPKKTERKRDRHLLRPGRHHRRRT